MSSTTFRVELFASPACDPSGFGEGATPIGAVDVTTDGSGNGSFGPLELALPAGHGAITATATDPGGNTSELSACVVDGSIFADGFESGDTSAWTSSAP